MLVAVEGDDSNRAILNLAFKKRPCLLIDCGNSADPYSIRVEEEWLDDVYVINAEAIYRFRDALKKTRVMMKDLKVKVLFVTSINALFSYDDPVEDKNVLTQCWEMLKDLSVDNDVYAVADSYSNGFVDEIWDTQLQVKDKL